MYTVYVHVNKINNKVYVGKTSRNPKYRWGKDGSGYLRGSDQKYFKNAINKYGWDGFYHFIVWDNCLTSEDAIYWEKELIRLYRSNEPNRGYNMTVGGEGAPGRNVTTETKEKIKESLIKYRDIKQYDLNGNLIRVWETVEEILSYFDIKSSSNLYSHLNGHQKSFCGFIFKLADDKPLNYKIQKTTKRVKCYTKDGVFTQLFDSMSDAARALNLSKTNITRCVKGQIIQTGGYTFRYDDGNYSNIEIRRSYSINCKPVLQFDLDGNLVNEYESITLATQETGIKNIGRCCRGVSLTAGGYIWSYKED